MKNSSKAIILLLSGIAAGAVLSLLLSKKGEETCESIAGSIRDFCKSAKKAAAAKIEQAKDKVKGAARGCAEEEFNDV